MGSNSNTYLSSDVSAENVVKAIAIILGSPKWKESFRDGGWYTKVDRNYVHTSPNTEIPDTYHVGISSTHSMQYFEIQTSPTSFDGVNHFGGLFLLPELEHPNHICIHAGVSPFWKEVGRLLVDMFGGYVDDDDCDTIDIDYASEKPRPSNRPTGDDEWHEFQQAFLELPVISGFMAKKIES